jgi:hypothetical protein
MAIVDDQGRLFGRFNLVDALVAVFAIGLIPLLYGAAMLFWQPQPVLTAVEPARLTSSASMRIRITGEHLRPYMRVSVGTSQGRDFLFRSTQEAEVNLPEMPPGVYDVVLYDTAQERSRLTQAITVLPSALPSARAIAVGHFGDLDADRARQLTPGTQIDGLGTIRRVGEPVPGRLRVGPNPQVDMPAGGALMLPAEVEVPCELRVEGGLPMCRGGGQTLLTNVVLTGRHSSGSLSFQIDQLRGDPELVTVTAEVKFSYPAEILSAIRVGDSDHGLYFNPLAAGATVRRVTRRGPNEADVVLDVTAERGPLGWRFQLQPLRAGAPVTIRTGRYEVAGVVQRITPEWSPAEP